MKNLNVFFFDSSRPMLSKFVIDSWKKFCFIEQNYKIIYHDDVIYPELSKQTEQWLNTEKDIILEQTKPNNGLGPAMKKMFTKYPSKYIFQIQCDYEFERPIDIDKCVWLMENNEKINAIIFNKRKNIRWINKFEYRNYTFNNNFNLVLSPGFHFQPGIWRYDFFMKHFKGWKIMPEANLSKAWKQAAVKASDPHKYLENNMGAYLYGNVFDYRYVRHIGNTWRCADWRRKSDNTPGGKIRDESAERCPWLPKLTNRPRATEMNKKDFK